MNNLDQLEHETPGDLLKNEEKWFKYLSVKNLLAICIASIPGIVIFLILKGLGHPLVGALVWAVLGLIAYLLTAIVLPPQVYPYTGGGQYLYAIILRRVFRKLTRCTYIKNYDIFTKQDKEG